MPFFTSAFIIFAFPNRHRMIRSCYCLVRPLSEDARGGGGTASVSPGAGKLAENFGI